MRHFIIALLLACAAGGVTQAQERKPGSAALQDFTGQYDLPDGRVLTVTQRQHTLVAQVDGRPAERLTASGPATFTAPAGRLTLTFQQHANGNVTAATLTETSRPIRQASR